MSTANPNLSQLSGIRPLSKEALPALYFTASQLYRNGKYDEAKDMFTLLLISDPEDRSFWMGLAASYQMLKDYPAAIECYSMATLKDPEEPLSHWHAAECYFASGNQSMALVALESAIGTAKKIKNLQPLVDQLTLIQEIWQRSS